MTVTNISPDIWEDFEAELQTYKRSRSEFDLSEWVEQLPSLGIHPLRGSITINCRKTGKSKIYQTGNVSSWVFDFSKDLQNGYFDIL